MKKFYLGLLLPILALASCGDQKKSEDAVSNEDKNSSNQVVEESSSVQETPKEVEYKDPETGEVRKLQLKETKDVNEVAELLRAIILADHPVTVPEACKINAKVDAEFTGKQVAKNADFDWKGAVEASLQVKLPQLSLDQTAEELLKSTGLYVSVAAKGNFPLESIHAEEPDFASTTPIDAKVQLELNNGSAYALATLNQEVIDFARKNFVVEEEEGEGEPISEEGEVDPQAQFEMILGFLGKPLTVNVTTLLTTLVGNDMLALPLSSLLGENATQASEVLDSFTAGTVNFAELTKQMTPEGEESHLPTVEEIAAVIPMVSLEVANVNGSVVDLKLDLGNVVRMSQQKNPTEVPQTLSTAALPLTVTLDVNTLDVSRIVLDGAAFASEMIGSTIGVVDDAGYVTNVAFKELKLVVDIDLNAKAIDAIADKEGATDLTEMVKALIAKPEESSQEGELIEG